VTVTGVGMPGRVPDRVPTWPMPVIVIVLHLADGRLINGVPVVIPALDPGTEIFLVEAAWDPMDDRSPHVARQRNTLLRARVQSLETLR
jgi:hypothetical protein